MVYTFKLLDESAAMTVGTWKYDAPYERYSLDQGKECIEELLNGTYYGVYKYDYLIGYFCFGVSATIPTGDLYNIYQSKEYMDVGIGLKPEFCGKNQGEEFFNEILNYGTRTFGYKKYRLTVAAYNERAIKLYEKIGFEKHVNFIEYLDDGENNYEVMLKEM